MTDRHERERERARERERECQAAALCCCWFGVAAKQRGGQFVLGLVGLVDAREGALADSFLIFLLSLSWLSPGCPNRTEQITDHLRKRAAREQLESKYGFIHDP